MGWRQSISLVCFFESSIKVAMSLPLKSCVQGSLFQDAVKTDLQNTVFLCFERHRTGHNTNPSKDMIKSACILYPAHLGLWSSDMVSSHTLPSGRPISVCATCEELGISYNCQTLSCLPESWVPGILLYKCPWVGPKLFNSHSFHLYLSHVWIRGGGGRDLGLVLQKADVL